MTEDALRAMGFAPRGSDGRLLAPAASTTTLAAIGSNFYELRITLADGTSVIAVLSKAALKLAHEDRAHAK
jgi:hypothetical protein